MQQKQDKRNNEKKGLRYRVFEVHSLIIRSFDGPHQIISIILQSLLYLQLMKFPVDYFTRQWLGAPRPLMSYFDLGYIFRQLLTSFKEYLLYTMIVVMGVYIIMTLSLFRPFSTNVTKFTANLLKVLFLVFSTFGFMPLTGLVLSLNACSVDRAFWSCNTNVQMGGPIRYVGFAIYGIFCALILFQSLLRFDFLSGSNEQRLLKDSSYTSTILLLYVIVNEVISMFWEGTVVAAVLTVSILFLVVVFLVKDQHHSETTKKIEMTLILINLLAIVLTDLKVFFHLNLQLTFLPLLVPFVIAAAMQYDSYSLKFQLENINKWSTPALMIKYCKSMRILCKRVLHKDFRQNALIFGYVDVHRQKCQLSGCPYRAASNTFTTVRSKDQKDQNCQHSLEIKRSHALIKRIYSEGCKISPVNPQLQLEYCIFLYDVGERDLSLKNLLLMSYDELSLQKYYKYFTLKKRICTQISEEARKDFLDLVSELEVKGMEAQLMKRFEEAALANLQFWSVLNEDHPDFQKLNDIGISLIKISSQVRKTFKDISSFVNNERITSLYIHYLTAIQNDEEMYNQIHTRIKRQHNLQEKIMIQDWSNSCEPTLLVSVEESNHGTITDINSTCASMLGYEKYQLINRHLKTLFKESCRSQLPDFLSIDHTDIQYFFLLHKNGYLVRATRQIRNYNSMETGQNLILTMNFSIQPYTSFFIASQPQYKVIGMSSSNIALFGIQNKTVQTVDSLQKMLKLSIQEVQINNNAGNCVFRADQIFSLDLNLSSKVLLKEEKESADQYNIHYKKVSKELCSLQLSLIRQKKPTYNVSSKITNFKFFVEANLTEFKYLSDSQQANSYIRQFSQFDAQSSLIYTNSVKNYANKITTLRLVDNIIKVIEDEDQMQDSGMLNSLAKDEDGLMQKIARKDEQEIFDTKDSFNEFIRKHRITMFIPIVVALGLALSLAMYGVYLVIYQGQNVATEVYFAEMNYQNRIIGMVAKQESYMENYRQHSMLQSFRSLREISGKYIENMVELQDTRLKGSSSYKIPIRVNEHVVQEFLSDQFLLSYSNYALDFINRIQNATTSQQVGRIYNNSDPVLIDYLINNGQSAREFMQRRLKERETQIIRGIRWEIQKQFLMLASGLGFEVLFGIVLFVLICKIHTQKANLLRIFLGITQLQILKFSAKTQKFLISLHMEQTSGELDLQGQQNEIKKISSTFAKKKRFKVVKLDKWVYFKILLIPIIAQAFFLHTFLISYANSTFMEKSILYMGYTASGDTRFYTGLTNLQRAFLGGPNADSTSFQFLAYYKEYYDSHYETFGHIPEFHDYFTNIFMMDICQGKVQVPNTCQGRVSKLTSNGSLLIFTDITVKTEERGNLKDFDDTYYHQYQILSDTHRLLTQKLVEQQKKVILSVSDQLTNAFLIWIFCVIAIVLIYGGPVIRNFLIEINDNKDMVTILPISIARQSPQLNAFIAKFLKHRSCCLK